MLKRSLLLTALAMTLLAGGACRQAADSGSTDGTPAPAAPDAAASPAAAASASPTSRTFEVTYTTSVKDLPAGAAKLELWIPYPDSDVAQQVEVEEVDSPYPTTVDTDPSLGNEMIHLVVDHPHKSAFDVTQTFRVTRTEKIRKDWGKAMDHHGDLTPDVARWLEPDRLVPLDKRIRDLSADVTKGATTDLEKARKIYEYVVSTMSYDKSGIGWGHGDIYWACDKKRGNCTDFHALFTGLARAAGIPARFEIGLPIPADRGSGEIGGYHCWVEFYLGGYGWVPIDASEAKKHPDKREYFFGAHDENRVQLSVGRDLELVPPQQGEPLNYFVYPYAEVDGKAWDGVGHKFEYRDLPMAGDEARTAG
jgi:transglutaminase-like putative cysteine protease